MKDNTNHRSTSTQLDERKVLLKMASKGITNYYDLAQTLGLSKCVFSTGFKQNQGFFGRNICVGLCLLFGCTLDDLRANEVEIPEQTEAQDIIQLIFEELKSIRMILEMH